MKFLLIWLGLAEVTAVTYMSAQNVQLIWDLVTENV